MKGYAETDVFNVAELQLLRRAQRIVDVLPASIEGRVIRCHELTRAVAEFLGCEVCDGWYGMVEHSWLWTKPLELFNGLPNVLDVYAPGRPPAVQLVHSSS